MRRSAIPTPGRPCVPRCLVGPLVAPFRDQVRLQAAVTALTRGYDGVGVRSRAGEEHFDAAVVAAHADDALRLLGDASADERAVLGAFAYQDNLAILHTDAALMPRRRKVWAAWNYHRLADPGAAVPVTYNMNILQGLDAATQFLVTLNREQGIAPERILARIPYRHPVFSTAAVAAQGRRAEINGARRTWFCGAYWGNGFHEDGVVSALAVARDFGLGLPAAEALVPHRQVGGAA